jgi:nucleotide-binding universal stress UspA family protein
MYRKIMVPLDGSHLAEIVLPYAEEIVARFGAEISLVTVSEATPTDIDRLYGSYLEFATAQVRGELKAWGVQEETRIHNEVLRGTPASEIINYADKNQIDLIAMASHGRSGEGPWLLGAIAGKVLRAADKPVLLIRVPASKTALEEKRLIRKILVPLDGSTMGEAGLPYAEMMAKVLQGELVLFHVLEPIVPIAAGDGLDYPGFHVYPEVEERRKASASAYFDKLSHSLRDRGVIVSQAIVSGSAANQIVDYAHSNAFDLIVMPTHGRSGLGRWVFGSVTDKVLHAGDTPVLTVRPGKA